MAKVQDEFYGDGFQGDIDYLNSDYDAGRPAEIRLLENILALGGGVGAAQLGMATPKLAKGAYGVLKGLGNAGKVALGGGAEGAGGAKAINKGLKFLAEPEEMAAMQSISQGLKPSSLEGVEVYVKGIQKGVNGAETPIYGVKGPADVLKAAFGDAAPASVPENTLIKLGLLKGTAQTGIATDIAAQKALMLAEETGGATFNLTQGNLAGKPVYSVSMYPERELIVEGEPTAGMIEQYMAKNSDLLNDASNSFGIWRDTESGKIYMDVVKTIADKKEAMKIGLENGQKAIFDLKGMKEIRLGKGK
jgi:hypothetical protein